MDEPDGRVSPAPAMDPWAFQRWAFATAAGNTAKKGLLVALATMADMSTGRCEAKQETLAQWTESKVRTVRANLAALERAGLIARRHQYRQDGKRRGDEFLLLAPGITTWPDGGLPSEPAPKRQRRSAAKNDTSTTGKIRHSLPAGNDPARTTTLRNDHSSSLRSSASFNAGASAGGNKVDLPEDFPIEVKPHLTAVFKVLRGVARRSAGAKEVKPLALAHVVMARPYKPLVKAAYDYAAWCEGNKHRHKDVVAGYRNWLERTDDLAAYEPLGVDGRPPPGASGTERTLSPRERKMEADEAQNKRLRETIMGGLK